MHSRTSTFFFTCFFRTTILVVLIIAVYNINHLFNFHLYHVSFYYLTICIRVFRFLLQALFKSMLDKP